MDHKAGHAIQILCVVSLASRSQNFRVGADRCVRPRSPIAIEYAMNTKRLRALFIHD